MNEHILTNYGIIRSFHDEGKSIIAALMPLVEFGIAKINENGQDHYDKESLDEKIFNECGVKIPLLTITTLLKKLEKDKKIELLDNQYFRILNIKSINQQHYLNEVQSTDRRINKFIDEYKKFSGDLKTDLEIKEELYSFIQISRNRQIGNYNVEDDNHLSSKYKKLYEFIDLINQKEDDLVKIFQDISFGFTLCSLLEREEKLENIKLKDFTIYLDSNFILRLLDLQEECFSKETKELFDLLKKSGAKLIVFEETINEVINVIQYYKEKYQNERKTIANIFEASRINGVFGAFFRRNLTITQIDRIIDRIEDDIANLGIATDKISRFNMTAKPEEIDLLYNKKYGQEEIDKEGYRYNKCSNYLSIVKIIKWQREHHGVRANCFGNSKYIFLTCDWKLYRFNHNNRKYSYQYPEIIIQEALIDNLILFFPENYAEISTDLIISVYKVSQYIDVQDLSKLENNMAQIIKDDSALLSYVISATRNIENYAEINQLYSESENPIDGFKKIVESQKEQDLKNQQEYEIKHENEISESYNKGKEDGREEALIEQIRCEAKYKASKLKWIRIFLISAFIIVPIILIVLFFTHVINLDEILIGENTKWLISSLVSIPLWALAGIFGKLLDKDEQYYYEKLMAKHKLKK